MIFNQIRGLLYPRLRPIARERSTSNCPSAPRDINTRKGTSLSASTPIKLIPQVSLVICQSGGTSNPVTTGDRNLKIQPLGEIRKRNPIANAAWGTASSGARVRFNSFQNRFLKLREKSRKVIAKDKNVAPKPEIRVAFRELIKPG